MPSEAEAVNQGAGITEPSVAAMELRQPSLKPISARLTVQTGERSQDWFHRRQIGRDHGALTNVGRKAGSSAISGIVDVARIAGVSAATVSRALSNPEAVTAEKRERVLRAVRKTGYQPNTAARSLRARRSMMVLVFVPNIANPFFSEVLHGIEEVLAAAGYGMIIANLDDAPAKEARYVGHVFANQVDGVILLNGHMPESDGRSLAMTKIPMVAACERIPGANCAQVHIDNRAASRAVARHLASLGHRRIAYLSGPPGNILDVERRAGFCDGLRAAGLDPAKAVFLPGDFSARSGALAGKQFLSMRDRPTAVQAANDEMAIGFVKAARDGGLSCPTDFSIIGFDGIDFAEFCEPALSTVRQPRYDIGATAATLLLQAILEPASNRRKRPADVRVLPTELLLRDSARTLREPVQAQLQRRLPTA
jgi:LacI family transcriptional regulator, repressor for deo operon, udp, cdd, tsx, nupC, and nupG